MKKLTKRRISNMAYKIAHECQKRGYQDVRIYFNDKAIDVVHRPDDTGLSLKLIDNIDPHDYFRYAAYDHILSMSFEGPFYYDITHPFRSYWVDNILNSYGVRREFGDSWNFTVFTKNENTEVEYTIYEKPIEPIYLWDIHMPEARPFAALMAIWRQRSKEYGDKGSCVLGAGFSFKYKGMPYFMPAQSPWQGSCSWESSIEFVRANLTALGCTDIRYNYGTMD